MCFVKLFVSLFVLPLLVIDPWDKVQRIVGIVFSITEGIFISWIMYYFLRTPFLKSEILPILLAFYWVFWFCFFSLAYGEKSA